MFSSIKMEEYIEPELSGIFSVKMVAKNKVLGSKRTHFVHMRVKPFVCIKKENPENYWGDLETLSSPVATALINYTLYIHRSG